MVDRPSWVADAIFYEIFPDRFRNGDPSNDPPGVQPWGFPPNRHDFQGGDLAGILEKLPYLEELGVNALYLTPIFAAGTNHRYDTHDYFQVDPALGDLELLRRLVREAHQAGLRVVLDGVFNHCGDGFWAFRDLVRQGRRSAYRDWFFLRGEVVHQDPPNYQTCGGAAYLPKLNTSHPELRRHLLEAATYWLEVAEIDGWRLDVPWKVPLEFWEEFRETVKASNPEAYLVGEVWRDAVPWLQVFDGVMNYPLRNWLLDFCLRQTMDAEDFAYEAGHHLQRSGEAAPSMLNLLGSHDTPRLLTLCGGDTRRATLALAALFTFPGAPMLYYGDELGLEGGDDPSCRGTMEWDSARWNLEVLESCRLLVGIRHAHPALRRGSWEPLLTFNGVLAARRRWGDDQLVVVLNPREARKDLAISLSEAPEGEWRDLLAQGSYRLWDGQLRLDSLGESSALLLVPAGNHG